MHSTRALIKSVIASTESIAEMYLYAVRVVQTKKSEYCLGLFSFAYWTLTLVYPEKRIYWI